MAIWDTWRHLLSTDRLSALWQALLGVAAYCKDSKQTAIRWSERHADYAEAPTLSKMAQWVTSAGPTTCAYLDSIRPGVCGACKFKGKISTPLQLGAPIPSPASSPDLPKGYVRNPKKNIVKVDSDGVVMEAFPRDIKLTAYGPKEGSEVVMMEWYRSVREGWQTMELKNSWLVDGSRDFASGLAEKGLLLNSDKQTRLAQAMLRTYKRKLEADRGIERDFSSQGWHDDAFLLGDEIISPKDIRKVSLSTPSTRAGFYHRKGTLERWRVVGEVMQAEHQYIPIFAMLVGLSAPLYQFMSMRGVVLSLCGPSGGGKTLAQYWAQSAWGDPSELHTTGQITINALFHKFGGMKSLPLTLDEFTTRRSEEVVDFLYWVSQGRSKERLSSASTPLPVHEWNAPVIVSTNFALSDKGFPSGDGHDAISKRMLELRVPVYGPFWESKSFGMNIYKILCANHGHAGRAMIELLVSMGRAKITSLMAEHAEAFPKRFGIHFSGAERFQSGLIQSAHFAGLLAKQAGLISIDPDICVGRIVQEFPSIREHDLQRRMDPVDILMDYVSMSLAGMVLLEKTGTKTFMFSDFEPQHYVTVRLERHRDNEAQKIYKKGKVSVSVSAFKSFLAGQHRMGVTEFYRGLEEMGIRVSKGRVTLTRDTHLPGGQNRCFTLDLDHPRLDSLLNGDQDKKMTLHEGGKVLRRV